MGSKIGSEIGTLLVLIASIDLKVYKLKQLIKKFNEKFMVLWNSAQFLILTCLIANLGTGSIGRQSTRRQSSGRS